MTNSRYSVSVVIPAHNEEKILENAVLHTMKTFQSLNLDFEMIIVDDRSTDKTGQIADSIASCYPNIYCFHHGTNQGSGGAFRTGIAHAVKKYVMFVPVDNPLDIEDMEAYLPRMNVCDIVVGYRVERLGYSGFARFASFVYNRILIPLLFNIGLTDVNWIQVYRRNLFSSGTIRFDNSRFFYLVEILVKARRQGLIIAEVPARMKRRMYGRATNTRFSVIARTIYDMLKFFWEIREKNKKL
ncbi:MAG: glycosyltransferase family 2 protein [Candidatus Aureabacteria bacterium]|nr:glycosyltransferase family 2 protein [Candidatus Auribacterota bacterium]MCK5655137.1 glycosyltransferase family 2 protein [Candidatus Auribacterota bacterium]